MRKESGQQPPALTTRRIAPRNGELIVNPDSWRKIRKTTANVYLGGTFKSQSSAYLQGWRYPTAISAGMYRLKRVICYGLKPASLAVHSHVAQGSKNGPQVRNAMRPAQLERLVPFRTLHPMR